MSTSVQVENKTVFSYEDYKAMPVGTVAADVDGYWSAIGRRYVKTTSNTWALFFHAPTEAEVAEAVKARRNNISPCPEGTNMEVAYPERRYPEH